MKRLLKVEEAKVEADDPRVAAWRERLVGV